MRAAIERYRGVGSIRKIQDQSGYSLVEVMASIMLLSIAIIPMVGMFDMGLNAATRGANYDIARAFANKQLERVENISYEDVRDRYPLGSSGSAPMTGGVYDNSSTPISLDTMPHQVPDGFEYTVVKRFKCISASTSSCATPTGGTSYFTNTTTDRRIVQVTVTVSWGSSNEYSATGIKAR